MKKLTKVFGLVAVISCLAVALIACGGDVKGIYKHSGTHDGVEIKEELELKDNDQFEMRMTFKEEDEEEKETVTGTYKIDGEKITLTVDEDGENGEHYTMDGIIKDGVITIEGTQYKK